MKKIILILFCLLPIKAWAVFTPIEISDAGTNIGIGTVSQANALNVVGALSVGDVTTAATAAPSNGALIKGNVGIGTLAPGKALDVSGTVRATAFLGDGSGLTGVAGGVSGLATNKLPKATASNTLGDSRIFDNGTNVGVGTIAPPDYFAVGGTSGFRMDSTGAITRLSGTAVSLNNTTATLSNAGGNVTFGNQSATAGSSVILQGGSSSTSSVTIKANAGGSGAVGSRIRFQNDNGTKESQFDNAGNLGIGTTVPVPSKFIVFPPTTAESITAGSTITADACGSVKAVTSAGSVTTNTTNTFTAITSGMEGCRMAVCNTGSNNIVLDNNANFKSAAGGDVTLTADDCVVVGVPRGSTAWYQLSGLEAN